MPGKLKLGNEVHSPIGRKRSRELLVHSVLVPRHKPRETRLTGPGHVALFDDIGDRRSDILKRLSDLFVLFPASEGWTMFVSTGQTFRLMECRRPRAGRVRDMVFVDDLRPKRVAAELITNCWRFARLY